MKEPINIIIEYIHPADKTIRTTTLDPRDIACRDKENKFSLERTYNLINTCFDEIIAINFRYINVTIVPTKGE